MILNPKIIEIYLETKQDWIRVNAQSLEPGDIVRFWDTPEKLTECNGCTIFLVQELPNIPCFGMTDEVFQSYIKQSHKGNILNFLDNLEGEKNHG